MGESNAERTMRYMSYMKSYRLCKSYREVVSKLSDDCRRARRSGNLDDIDKAIAAALYVLNSYENDGGKI